ncbi:hypothetical protein [Shewanella marina]|uniref:hypothetical protein n=1 Tax=Shewanella marina TaxID=487319 RepID=UPI000470C2E9|nr:hypothetical protein [Shewanella marina]
MNKRIFKYARKLHKWFGYMLALQILLWLIGGLVMSAIPLALVHGKHIATKHITNPLNIDDYLIDINAVTQQYPQLQQLLFSHRLNQAIIEVITPSKRIIIDAVTGQLAVPLSQIEAQTIAKQHYLGSGSIQSSQYLAKGPRETGYKPQLWAIQFDDVYRSTLYIDANSGQLHTIRSHIWRIFDFFWMLHIMDYDEREDFNNPLLISFASFSVLFCLTGILLLFQQIKPFRIKRK